MNTDMEYRQRVVKEYREQVEPLLKYVPWLQNKQGAKASSTYAGDGLGEHSVPVPVYDGTLMNFVKDVQKTKLLDRNYVYVYSRLRIRNVEDERRAIASATLREMDVLTGILAKYVMGGMTKATLWPEAVENGIFLQLLLKMKEILEFWDQPLA